MSEQENKPIENVDEEVDEYEDKEFNHGRITLTEFSSEMKKSFLEYSMSVIVSRALPDARDGMKPVHRRIVYGMNDLGTTPDKPHRKSARIVGDVMGRFHPHGDSSIYEALVRMAQDFSYRYPLVDGHGNFGSIDGDGAAAMRYTEARMSKISLELVRDINKDTVDWIDNYQGDEKEPVVLPSRFPNLLANGNQGIAVGMATNIPPHNLTELINACELVMKQPDCDIKTLMGVLKGPDFPTGGIIVGRSGIRNYFETGKGSVVIRSKVETQLQSNGKAHLIVSEIPYAVNKSVLVEKIAEMVREKVIEGIVALTDTSNMNGIHIDLELKKDAQPDVILNQLYRLTPLQSTFAVNNIVLINNTPKLCGVKELLQVYNDHQKEVITRRTRYDLKKAQDRAHILEGFRIAIDAIDEVVKTIRHSKGTEEQLVNELMSKFGLSQIQSKAILSMQLRRLSGLERDKIEAEYQELLTKIADFKDILANNARVEAIVMKEWDEIKVKYGDERRTEIIEGDASLEDEDLIPRESIVVTLTHNGYFKRLPIDTYRVQNRGGKGIKGMGMNEDDLIDQFISMSTHDYLLVFTNFGRVYRMKGYNVPLGSRISKGVPIVNFLSLDKGEKVATMLALDPNQDRFHYLFFATTSGLVKKTEIKEFDNIRASGKIAITLREGDELLKVIPTSGEDEIILSASNGKAVRFSETGIRASGRTSMGVRGMNTDGSICIGLTSNILGTYILTVSENGLGKLSDLNEYRLSNRGGKGVKTINITDKTGALVVCRAVNGDEDALMMSNDGIMIRISLESVGVKGRATQGIKLMSLKDGARVQAISIVPKLDETLDETVEDGEVRDDTLTEPSTEEK